MKFYTGILIFFLSSLVICQPSVNSSATIKVKLIKSLKIEKVKGNLNFGEVILNGAGQNLLKNPADGIEFLILGHPEKEAVVSYQPALLYPDNQNTANTLLFLPAVFETGNNINFTTPQNVKNGTAVHLENDDGTGVTFIWVGGKINVKANQPEGDYKGIFTISVAY